MGKKRLRSKYTSSGNGGGYSKKTKNAVRAMRSPADDLLNRWEAYMKGQNPWLTLPNPNKNETNKRMIRVKANDHWGNPRRRSNKFSFNQPNPEGEI